MFLPHSHSSTYNIHTYTHCQSGTRMRRRNELNWEIWTTGSPSGKEVNVCIIVRDNYLATHSSEVDSLSIGKSPRTNLDSRCPFITTATSRRPILTRFSPVAHHFKQVTASKWEMRPAVCSTKKEKMRWRFCCCLYCCKSLPHSLPNSTSVLSLCLPSPVPLSIFLAFSLTHTFLFYIDHS